MAKEQQQAKGQAAKDPLQEQQETLAAACARNVPVELHTRNRMDELTVGKSRLLSLDGATLQIDRPTGVGGSVSYAASQPLEAYFSLDGVLHMFKTTVKEPEIPVALGGDKRVMGMALERPKKIEAGQRRLNYRVSLASAEEIPVDLHTASRADPNACPLDARRLSGKLADLSLGGAAIRMRGALQATFRPGDRYFMRFSLPGETMEMRLLAEVKQSRDIMEGAASRLGVRFVRWPDEPAMRQSGMALQRFIAKMQRAMLKRAG